MEKLVNSRNLKFRAARLAGSSPAPGTNKEIRCDDRAGKGFVYKKILEVLHVSAVHDRNGHVGFFERRRRQWDQRGIETRIPFFGEQAPEFFPGDFVNGLSVRKFFGSFVYT